MNKFLKWYIKGSAIYTGVLLIIIISGDSLPIIDKNSSRAINTFYSFLIALSPLGALFGYILLWILLALWHGVLGMFGIEKNKNKGEINYTKTSDNGICPFEGNVMSEKDSIVLGINIRPLATIFTICEDWSVLDSKGNWFGWVDRDGNIRKSSKLSQINLDATLTGKVIGRIYGESFYINDEKVGILSTAIMK